MVSREERRRWNKIDWEFYVKLIAIVVASLLLLFGVMKMIIWTYKELSQITQSAVESKVVNDELRKLYAKGEELGMRLVRKQDMDRMQNIYDDITLAMQQQVIIDAHTKLSQKVLPYGTNVYIKDICKAVKVNSYNGLDIGTVEKIHFLITDEDNYYTISEHYYRLCKRIEEENERKMEKD